MHPRFCLLFMLRLSILITYLFKKIKFRSNYEYSVTSFWFHHFKLGILIIINTFVLKNVHTICLETPPPLPFYASIQNQKKVYGGFALHQPWNRTYDKVENCARYSGYIYAQKVKNIWILKWLSPETKSFFIWPLDILHLIGRTKQIPQGQKWMYIKEKLETKCLGISCFQKPI